MRQNVLMLVVFMLLAGHSASAVDFFYGNTLALNLGRVRSAGLQESAEQTADSFDGADARPYLGVGATIGFFGRILPSEYFAIQQELMFNFVYGGSLVRFEEDHAYGDDEVAFLIYSEGYLTMNLPLVAYARVPIGSGFRLAPHAGVSFDVLLTPLGSSQFVADNPFGLGRNEEGSDDLDGLDWERTGLSWIAGLDFELEDRLPFHAIGFRLMRQFDTFGPEDDDERTISVFTVSLQLGGYAGR